VRNAFGSYKGTFFECQEVDVVYCHPHTLHSELAIMAMDHGTCLCEKPWVLIGAGLKIDFGRAT